MKPFVGRALELQRLNDLSRAGRGGLVVIKGRRRIGKSRLAEEFGKGKHFLPFSGLAPVKGVSAQDQRDAFARQLASLFSLPPFTFTDWSDGFSHLFRCLQKEPTVILFDEISWMGSKDPAFVSKLKAWWDLSLQNHLSAILILCGSVSTWIDKNIVNSTAFFGRVSLYVELSELSIRQSKEFLRLRGFKGSDFEIFKILSVTGGVPWYLEQIHVDQSADENIRRMAFEKNGLLVHEFDRIFYDLFSTRGAIYKQIITLLSQGMKERAFLQKELGYAHSGTLSLYLNALEVCGFVSKHCDWSFKTGKKGKRILYCLCDNYLRFFLHFIEPNLEKIKEGAFLHVPLSGLVGWDSVFGLQLETLLLKNRSLLYEALRIYPQDIVMDNPYVQKASGVKRGCQIDYLIQMRSNTLLVCEIKVRRRALGLEVIDEMQDKMDVLSIPKGFGIAPVLFHLGPLSDALMKSSYFYQVIDIADL